MAWDPTFAHPGKGKGEFWDPTVAHHGKGEFDGPMDWDAASAHYGGKGEPWGPYGCHKGSGGKGDQSRTFCDH